MDGVWQPAQRYEDRLLDSIALKCRFSVVTRDDFTLGVVSVHDFGKFHTMLFVHYDPKSKEWKGPIVEAPFNDWNIDGACPNFQANGEKMIWSAGYDHGPDLISGGSSGGGGVYDLFWLPTNDSSRSTRREQASAKRRGSSGDEIPDIRARIVPRAYGLGARRRHRACA